MLKKNLKIHIQKPSKITTQKQQFSNKKNNFTEEEKIKKKINSSEKNKKNKKSSRRKTDENQIEDRIKKQMDGIVLQKTVTINKEDLR